MRLTLDALKAINDVSPELLAKVRTLQVDRQITELHIPKRPNIVNGTMVWSRDDCADVIRLMRVTENLWGLDER